MTRLRDLQGLGPKSEQQLMNVGIRTVEELKKLGPVEAFLKLKAENDKVSLNFLYALVGAVEGKSWLAIAREERSRLLMDLQGREELQALFEKNCPDD